MNESLLKFYKGKKVFVTGHTGFKGSWLVYWLHSLGAIVKGYALAPEFDHSLFNLIRGDELCESVFGDIRDSQKLYNEIKSFSPEIIFHFAAQPLVIKSYADPESTYETNVLGTAYLLRAIRELETHSSTVIITTDKVYENKEWEYPYREVDVLGGYDPYSSSKAACEILVSSYRKCFFQQSSTGLLKGLAVARAGNVIGGGDWAEYRIIPDIVRALNSNEPVIIRNPYSVRPWQHVLEPLYGYLVLANKLHCEPIIYSDAWNFGPYLSDSLQVEEVVKLAIKIWGIGKYEISTQRGNLHEAGILKLDISKANSLLNWNPKWNCEDAITHTINWYKHIYKRTARELLQFDISSYTSI